MTAEISEDREPSEKSSLSEKPLLRLAEEIGRLLGRFLEKEQEAVSPLPMNTPTDNQPK